MHSCPLSNVPVRKESEHNKKHKENADHVYRDAEYRVEYVPGVMTERGSG